MPPPKPRVRGLYPTSPLHPKPQPCTPLLPAAPSPPTIPTQSLPPRGPPQTPHNPPEALPSVLCVLPPRSHTPPTTLAWGGGCSPPKRSLMGLGRGGGGSRLTPTRGSARLGSVRWGSAQLGSVRRDSAGFGSARRRSARWGSAGFGSVRQGSAGFGSVRRGSARLGCVRPRFLPPRRHHRAPPLGSSGNGVRGHRHRDLPQHPGDTGTTTRHLHGGAGASPGGRGPAESRQRCRGRGCTGSLPLLPHTKGSSRGDFGEKRLNHL